METRSFRVVPRPQGSEIEIGDVLKKKALQKAYRFAWKHENDGDSDDDISSLSTNSRNSNNKEKRERFCRHSIDTIDIRDDDTSPSAVLGSYHRKDRHSMSKVNLGKQNAPISETEKRIARLQSAGLSISTKNPSPISSAKKFQSPRYKQEEREGPPIVAFKSTFTGSESLGSKKSSALQALIEKDSRRIQKAVGTPPPHSCSGRSSSPTRTESPPSQSLEYTKTEGSLDPIIVARPSYQGMRVPRNQYPDPVSFGWTFIGSCEELQVEFFEKSLHGSGHGTVVLEFHYTTGTFKVTLNNNGVESLLAFCLGSLAPRIYRKILLDPLGCSNITGENL